MEWLAIWSFLVQNCLRQVKSLVFSSIVRYFLRFWLIYRIDVLICKVDNIINFITVFLNIIELQLLLLNTVQQKLITILARGFLGYNLRLILHKIWWILSLKVSLFTGKEMEIYHITFPLFINLSRPSLAPRVHS